MKNVWTILNKIYVYELFIIKNVMLKNISWLIYIITRNMKWVKFCNISSYFVFQVFQHLFTRPSLLVSFDSALCEGPSSSNNVQMLVLDCSSIISNEASSSATGLPKLGFIFEAGITFLEMSEPVLCQTFVDSSWAFYTIILFCLCPCTQSFFLQVG